VIYPYHGILFGSKKEVLMHATMSFENTVLSEEAITKGHIPYDSVYLKF